MRLYKVARSTVSSTNWIHSKGDIVACYKKEPPREWKGGNRNTYYHCYNLTRGGFQIFLVGIQKDRSDWLKTL